MSVPAHRLSPLKKHWLELYNPITKLLQLDMRMNLKTRKVRPGLQLRIWNVDKVEIKTTEACKDAGLLQKAADFVNAFILG